eukprot:TRINITY_DN3018_c0_g1_i6.p1 TRINITY_DN3018_c0_g1~~TRINITY_DN3018_c0_g1_i6.p1  ORF type:complete len:646 (-),score=73.75 TRINITY_DN3018_c0_g1_i6:226-2064(-)
MYGANTCCYFCTDIGIQVRGDNYVQSSRLLKDISALLLKLFICIGSISLVVCQCDVESTTYLAANADTVRWGYYDPTATPQAYVKSGDTITVELVTHLSGHDYAKMIQGDEGVESIFYWLNGTTLEEKPVPKFAGTGVHIITGPIEVCGAEPGDVLQVDILDVVPRPNPLTQKTYGTNSQKFAGYQFRVGHRDGSEYSRDGGHEFITVYEFVTTPSGNFAWGKPVYQYMFPTIVDAAGELRTFDGMPCVVIPHEINYGYNLTEIDYIDYPEGFDGTIVVDAGDGSGPEIFYNPYDPQLDWKVPLRPHLGIMAVMSADSLNSDNEVGANTIPPAKFGGNIDDWRIGAGGTMYYTVEMDGAMLVLGDPHAAQGDSELAGTAMETSLTATIKVTLHKKDSLPKLVSNLDFPLLETAEQFVVHGFAFFDYLSSLEEPSSIFTVGASLDLAMEDTFNKTRAFLMDVYDLTEPEAITLMSLAVDFGITQVVDGNWGVHADISKWIFEKQMTPYDYSCDVPPGGRGRRLMSEEDWAEHYASITKQKFSEEDPNHVALMLKFKKFYQKAYDAIMQIKSSKDGQQFEHLLPYVKEGIVDIAQMKADILKEDKTQEVMPSQM